MATIHDKLARSLQSTTTRPVLMLGTGVSLLATQNRESCLTWRGLLENGVHACRDLGHGTDEWEAIQTSRISSADIQQYLEAAEVIVLEIGTGFSYWLQELIGVLKPTDDRLTRALLDLDLPIVTTNYDMLLEQSAKQIGRSLEAIDWTDSSKLRAFSNQQGCEPLVLHLHGCVQWPDPNRIVFSRTSYNSIRSAQHIQALFQELVLHRTLVFIGYGEGLCDPHFDQVMAWASNMLGTRAQPHFALLREDQKEWFRGPSEHSERV